MDDAELMRRAQDGDDGAFGELVRRYLDSVYVFLSRSTGDESVAEDATQEAFLKAWRAVKSFDVARPVKPWLYGIARNAAQDILRKKRTRLFSELSRPESDTTFEDTLADPAPLPPELFDAAELGSHVTRALGELPERERAILLMRYADELPWEEVATALAAPVNTVKSWHRRALLKLRDALAPFAPNRHDGS
jgi:RNA polymerase sigma-70 factor (ECF subfamily)